MGSEMCIRDRPEIEPEDEAEKQEDSTEPQETEVSSEPMDQMDTATMHKDDMDRLVAEKGVDKAVEILEKCKVVKLRNLAREYEDFGIAGRLISKANKTVLLEEFRKYYNADGMTEDQE